MENLLTQLVANSPVAVALLLMYWMGNKSNERRDSDHEKSAAERDRDHEKAADERLSTIRQMSVECHAAQDRGSIAVERNTEFIGRNIQLLEQMSKHLNN